jgi:hypothetical protein
MSYASSTRVCWHSRHLDVSWYTAFPPERCLVLLLQLAWLRSGYLGKEWDYFRRVESTCEAEKQ